MKNFCSIIICQTLLLFVVSNSFAQEFISNDIQNYFNEINVDEGLSAANVNAIAKDESGFIWVGTEYGLNRYDGNSVLVYQYDPSIKTSISSNLIYDIVADKNGDVWVATKDGLNRFNHLTEDFTYFKDPKTRNIFPDIELDTVANRIWIAANAGGLKYLDLEKDSLAIVTLKTDYNPLTIKVLGDILLVGTKSKGIVFMDKQSFEITKVITPSIKSPIMDLTIAKDNIWAATNKEGLIKISKQDFNSVDYINSSNSEFNSAGALCLDVDQYENLLVGTDGKGLFIYDTKSFYNIIKGPSPNGLRSNAIRDIFVDNENNIWLGTYARGINMQPSQNRTIKNYQNDLTSKNSLSKSFVLCVEESKSGRIYIGTDRGGLNILENNKFSKIDIPGDVILSLHEDSKERLWIGTYQHGIFFYENNKLTNLAEIINDSSFNTNSVWSITEDSHGNIWFGLTNYLIRVDKESFSFTAYQNNANNPNSLINNTVRSLLVDADDRLWIGTIRGLSIFNLKTSEFDFVNETKSLSKKLISSIASSKGNVYIGTHGEGIYIFNNNLEITESLTKKKNGLAHNVILDLIFDNSENLWASTPNGISKIYTSSKKVEIFTSSDGLIGNTFNPRSGQLLSSGKLAFGTTQGLSIFNPDSISNKINPPQTILTGLRVLNDNILIDSTILDKSISYTKSFSLPPKQNSISINYVGLHYANPKKVVYKYILEGFEEEWRIAKKSQTSTYTNLTPGDYTFKVIASSGNNNWTESPASVNIIVLPHWWETNYARIGFLLAVVGVLFLVIKIRTSRLFRQKKNLESQVRERTVKLEKAYGQLSELNNQLETKVNERTQKLEKSNSELDRFVYSASHDLSAPLKSISGLLNLVKIDKTINTEVYLNKIETSIFKLEEVIQNLIQFSRNSRQEVRNEPIDLDLIAKELQEELIYVDSISTRNNLECIINVKSDFVLVSDPVRLKIILSNFLSNAIKYRKEDCNGKIAINGYKKNETIHISVEDNGIGIEEEYLEKIFEMFYRATDLSKGSGLGLYIVKESAEKINAKVSVKSKVSEGSTFTLSFPAL